MKARQAEASITKRVAVVLVMTLVGATAARGGENTLVIDVNKTGEVISPLLFGHNLEHTRYAFWKGLSAELIANRKFAGKSVTDLDRGKPVVRGEPGPDGVAAHWQGLGGPTVKFELEAEGPPTMSGSVQKIFMSNPGKSGGIGQKGIPIQEGTEYKFRIWEKSDHDGSMSIKLKSAGGKAAYAENALAVHAQNHWVEHTFSLKPRKTDAAASLEIVASGPGTVCIGAVSLMLADNFLGMRRDVIDLLKQVSVPFLRWPGGDFSFNYRWQDGLLPVDIRPPTVAVVHETLPFTDNYDFHEIGTDEFIALCREIGAEPFLTFNTNPKIASAKDAAEWVEYCNGSKNTRWGSIRAKRGFEAPYAVKWWSIGNEVQLGHEKPGQYAAEIREYAEAVKKVDSSVKLVASGDGLGNDGMDWNKRIVKESGGVFDCLSVHAYAPPASYASDKAAAESANLAQFPEKRLLPWLAKVRKDVDDNAPTGRKIGLSYDEWNLWHKWFTLPGSNKWEVGPIDAVFAAVHLNMLGEKASELGIECACYFQPVNEGLIAVEPFSAKLTATGQVFALYRAHQGNRLLKIAGDLAGISACASLERDGKTIFVSLVNQNPEKPQDFRIVLLNVPGGVAASARCLVADDLKPNRPFREQPLAVKVEENKVAGVLPKLSVAMIRLLLL